jgi:hypothetical protein
LPSRHPHVSSEDGRCSFDTSPCEDGTLSFRSIFLQTFDAVPFLF